MVNRQTSLKYPGALFKQMGFLVLFIRKEMIINGI